MTTPAPPVVYVAIMEEVRTKARWQGDPQETRATAKEWGLEVAGDREYFCRCLGTRAVPLEPDEEGKA